MRRSPRTLLNALTALSLLLCVATVVLWVRSYWVVDTILWNGTGESTQLSTSDCTLQFWHLPGSIEWNAKGWSYETFKNNRPEYVWGMYEFRTDVGELKVALPCWLLCSGAAVLAVMCTSVRLACRPRRKLGLCPTCNYDLRATPDRCPECGTAVARAV